MHAAASTARAGTHQSIHSSCHSGMEDQREVLLSQEERTERERGAEQPHGVIVRFMRLCALRERGPSGAHAQEACGLCEWLQLDPRAMRASSHRPTPELRAGPLLAHHAHTPGTSDVKLPSWHRGHEPAPADTPGRQRNKIRQTA